MDTTNNNTNSNDPMNSSTSGSGASPFSNSSNSSDSIGSVGSVSGNTDIGMSSDIDSKPLPPYVGMSSYTPPAPSANTTSDISSTIHKDPLIIDNEMLANETAKYNKSRASVGSGASHIYLWAIISFVVLLAIGGGAYWYFFMQGGASDMTDTANTNTQNSAFPAGAINNNPAKPTTSAPVNTKPTVTKPATVTPALNGSQRDIIEAFIRKNINSISPRKSSIAFTVTDVTFDGPDRALVSYSNGNVSYTAVVVASVSATGAVRISSFTVLTK